MKDKTDTSTMEFPWLDNLRADAAANKYRYRFYIRTATAQTEWTGLTRKQARDMHAYTEQSQPNNVVAFGWEERA